MVALNCSCAVGFIFKWTVDTLFSKLPFLSQWAKVVNAAVSYTLWLCKPDSPFDGSSWLRWIPVCFQSPGLSCSHHRVLLHCPGWATCRHTFTWSHWADDLYPKRRTKERTIRLRAVESYIPCLDNGHTGWTALMLPLPSRGQWRHYVFQEGTI